MKFRTVGTPDPENRVRRSHTHGRPQWLKNWIEDKGRFVILSCGHKEDLNDKALLVINVFARRGEKTDVLCERCNRFVRVKEIAKLPPKAIPDEPLF